MSCVLVLLMAIDVVVVLLGLVLTCPDLTLWGCLYLSFHIKGGGRGYKEGNRVGYNMISIKTLSLLSYFTYKAQLKGKHKRPRIYQVHQSQYPTREEAKHQDY
jgi:hypothetical protein